MSAFPNDYDPLAGLRRVRTEHEWKMQLLQLAQGAPEEAKRGPRFYELLAELRDLHDAKAHDYAPGEDRFLNFRQCEALGVPAYEGAVIRMTDKMSRLTNLIKRGKGGDGAAVADESLVDTLRDLACYSLITIELYEQHRG